VGNDTIKTIETQQPGSVLEQIARQGAQRMLAQALDAEVAEFLARHADRRDANGRHLVVRNGHLPERDLITGIGRLRIKQPRVDDRSLPALGQQRFSSAIVPRYARRAPSVDDVIPVLYLQGVSSGDFSEALEAILGEGASGLSARIASIMRCTLMPSGR